MAGGCASTHSLTTKACTPTCDAVLNLPLHLQRVHINGPIPNEARTGDAPVRLAEPVLVVVISGKDTQFVSVGKALSISD